MEKEVGERKQQERGEEGWGGEEGGWGGGGGGGVALPFICVALLSFTSESFIFKQAVFFLLTVRVCTEEQMVAVGGCCRLNRQSRVGCRELLPLWRDEGIGGWGGGGGSITVEESTALM